MIRNEPKRSARNRAWYWSLGTLWCTWLAGSFPGFAAQVSSFKAGDSSWHLGTLAVGNLDSTPDLEMVVPYRDSSGNWFLDAFKYTGQRLPGFPYSSGGQEINASPTLYDLDGDGRDEIIFTCGNHVIALRGDGSVLWSNTVSSANYVPNGGYQTVTGGFYWYPGGAWMTHLPTTAVFSSQVSPPIVMDLAGTRTPEVITAWKIQPDPAGGGQDYNPFIFPIFGVGQWGTMGETWSGGVVTFDSRTGGQSFVYHLHHLVESGLAVGRPTAPGPLQIYELNDSDSVVCFDKTKPFGLWGKGMLHRQFGKNQRLMSGSYLFPIDIYAADLDGDGLDEVLVAGTQLSSLWQPNETILDDDGAILWRRWLPHISLTNYFGWLNSAALIPCNPDHDNHADVLGFNHSYEITFRYWNGAELVDRAGWPKNFFPFLPTPPVVGDVDVDGLEEIVIGTYDPGSSPSTGKLLVFALDGTLKQSLDVPGGIKHIPALAPVEGNGRLDVVYRSTQGQVYVQNFGATTAKLVSWSTHRGNMHRDGNCGVGLYPPGTPMITNRASGFNRASFGWSLPAPAQLYRIYRAEGGSGPFQHIATFTGGVNSFTNYGLRSGWQYFYEVAAVYADKTVHSAPFAITPLLNNNLVANAGFERNENCRWDKWFTGSIEMTNMVVSTNVAHQGMRSMRIVLNSEGNNSTVAQYNQYGIPDATIYATPGAFYSYGGYFKTEDMTQASEHWLEWSSTKTAYDTNCRPALPDPYYYTPHFVAPAGSSDWTYVNRTFQLPSGFPNIELRHRYTINAPGSGSVFLDDLFFRPIPSPSATNWTTWIPFGSTWRYFTNTPPSNWFATNFNDTSWPAAPAKFGNGSGPVNIATRIPQCRPAYYFRKKFVVSSTDVEELLLLATCTDASVSALYPLRVFLNGTEVRACIDAVTMQGNDTRYFDLTPFVSLIQPGTNLVAVQLGNYWSDYDDIAFDVCLKAVIYNPVLPRLSFQYAGGTAPNIAVATPPKSLWRLQSSDQTARTGWQLMQAFTNSAGGWQAFQDTGQNGRCLPEQATSRVYRLIPF